MAVIMIEFPGISDRHPQTCLNKIYTITGWTGLRKEKLFQSRMCRQTGAEQKINLRKNRVYPVIPVIVFRQLRGGQ